MQQRLKNCCHIGKTEKVNEQKEENKRNKVMARQQEKAQKEKDKVIAAKKKRKAMKHDTSSETEEEDEWTDSQDQHFGTRAPPRELLLENSIMPSDPGSVRVATPPRVITLDEHYFPTADEYMSLPPAPEPTHEEMTAIVKPKPRFNVDHRMHVRESTPPLSAGDSLTTNEEITHLRRQMAKMNRRMMALELDSLQRQQREKFLYAVGLAYFLLKTVLWLGRS
uniref:Mff-like domain-containing protein n=1 Tax=Timema genevievae TaxID=629358 RepID=A0A7R9JWQ2_TIMGE|nr:unnamed protein product [Timema genevievae]